MENRVAIVTGAGSGIGRASAVALAGAGFRVALLGRRVDRLEETGAMIGEGALVVRADVSNERSVVEAFDVVRLDLGRIDVLYNNAGTNTPPMPIDELSLDQWRTVIDINLTGAFLCAREAFRHMKPVGGGRVINNGSISAHVPRLYSAPYTASKHGITGLTRALALEGRKFNIAVGQIDIGNAQSEMSAGAPQGQLQPNGERVGEPVIDADHVARAVVYMATLPPEANVLFMTVMATQMPFVGRG
jgi:NAD(P)-dependent dehydrogenase (short-subunit alcohol dehydrogenase family)